MSDAADPSVHDDPGHDAAGQSAPAGRSPFTSIIVQGEVLARIEAELSADPSAEFGGVLIGNAAPSTNFVLVTGSLAAAQPVAEAVEPPAPPDVPDSMEIIDEAEPTEAPEPVEPAEPAEPPVPANFTFTAAALEDLARQVAETHPGQRIVGWYHSHPGTGIFLSAHDLYLHSAFFAKTWQVGYVFDPVQAQSGFFGWSDREVVRIPHWETTSRTFAPGADSPVHVPVHGFSADRRDVAVAPLTFGAPLGPPAAALAGGVDPAPKKRPIAAIVVAAVVILALIIAAFVIASGDDESPSSTTDGTTQQTDEGDASATTPVPVETVPVETDAATEPSTEGSTGSTDASATTAPPVITFPDTPTEVQQPAARVGTAAVACESTGPGTYAPLADCFVPLNNGNIMVFASGSLRCTEPAGEVLANEAQEFTIGVPTDPLVLVADGVLSPTCIDLTYAKNVLAGGSDTLDGMCGSSGTQINDGTRRCLAHNTTSGSVAAVVRSAENQTDLVATCVSAGASSAVLPLTWSNDSVSTSWRVDSVLFDAETEMFTATASDNGPTATATFACG